MHLESILSRVPGTRVIPFWLESKQNRKLLLVIVEPCLEQNFISGTTMRVARNLQWEGDLFQESLPKIIRRERNTSGFETIYPFKLR